MILAVAAQIANSYIPYPQRNIYPLVMRAYNVSTVAHSLDVSERWLDNVLSHHELKGVERERQGISRRLAPDTVVVLHIANMLINSLGATTAYALLVAEELSASGIAELAPGVIMTVDRDVLRASLNARLLEAVQVAPPKARGRPPSRRAG
jgi:hypothetical protein